MANRALIVDDDPILRSILTSKLHGLIDDVVEADDGAVAWPILSSEEFQIAFVDLEMPNLDGVSLIRCIRSHPKTRHLPVVVITGRQDAGALRLTLDAGATSYLVKPLNWSMFEHHIGHVLALGRAQTQLEDTLKRHENALSLLDDRHVNETQQAGELAAELHRALEQSGAAPELVQAAEQLVCALDDQVEIASQLRAALDDSSSSYDAVAPMTASNAA